MTIYDAKGGVIAKGFLLGDVDGNSLLTQFDGHVSPLTPSQPRAKKCTCGTYLNSKGNDEFICDNPNHYADAERKRKERNDREKAERLAEEIKQAQAEEKAFYENELKSGTIDVRYHWTDGYEIDLTHIERTLNVVLKQYGITAKLDEWDLTFEKANHDATPME